MKDKDQKYFNLGENYFFFPKPNQTENQRIAEHGTSVFCSKTVAGNSPAGKTR